MTPAGPAAVGPPQGASSQQAAAPAPPAGAAEAFGAALQEAVQRSRVQAPAAGLRLSAHAAERLSQAGLQPAAADWDELGRAVGRVAARGGRQALVLWGSCALVVAVPDRTVVTAVSAARMGEHVFTGIDSAVVVPRA